MKLTSLNPDNTYINQWQWSDQFANAICVSILTNNNKYVNHMTNDLGFDPYMFSYFFS